LPNPGTYIHGIKFKKIVIFIGTPSELQLSQTVNISSLTQAKIILLRRCFGIESGTGWI
jgi:hypothetical protein